MSQTENENENKNQRKKVKEAFEESEHGHVWSCGWGDYSDWLSGTYLGR